MIIAFDLNGTLTDLRALTGDDRGRVLFDRALLLAMADTLSGTVLPFSEYVRAVLERDAPAVADSAMSRFATLPAQPGAAEALKVLRDAGLQTAVVTNSTTAAAEATLVAAGLRGLVNTVVGTDGVGAYKPDPRVYRNAERRLDASPDQLCLVAAHAWDVRGARRAGWNAAWVGHTESSLVPSGTRLSAAGATLPQVARALARRCRREHGCR